MFHRLTPHSPVRRQLCATAVGLPLLGGLQPLHASDQLISTAQLRDDLAHWRQTVWQRHPRYHGAAALEPELDAAFAQATATLARPLSRAEAWRHFARLNPLFRDAHTLLMPWPEGEAPNDAARRRLFPFGLALGTDGRLRLRSSWQRAADGQRLAAGAPVLAINGVASESLLQQLAPFSHGETAALRRHMLTLMLPQWLHAVLGWRDRFELSLGPVPGSGGLTVAATADDRWTPQRPARDLPSLRLLGDSTALLPVSTFDVDEDPADFAAAVATAFRTLRSQRVTRLIIDVRGNTGGQSDAGAEVLRHFITRPAQQVSRARERLNSDNNGWLGWRGAPGTMREFDLGREGLVEPAPAADRFQGTAVVLIDEMSYSATILFATAMQDLKLATLIGRPTGGHANQTGNMVPLRLPNTGLSGYIASREFVRPNGDLRAAPVQPDIVVAAAPADPLADPVLERAQQWLRTGR
jgi:hypothetical protein